MNVPANPECLVAARSAGINTRPLIGWAEKALDQGGMLLIPRAELEALREAAGTRKIYRSAAVRARRRKSLNTGAQVANILVALDVLEDSVELEESLEGDGSDIAARLTESINELGRFLVDITQEEVAELIDEENGPENMPGDMPADAT